jgi:hypothetical protein
MQGAALLSGAQEPPRAHLGIAAASPAATTRGSPRERDGPAQGATVSTSDGSGRSDAPPKNAQPAVTPHASAPATQRAGSRVESANSARLRSALTAPKRRPRTAPPSRPAGRSTAVARESTDRYAVPRAGTARVPKAMVAHGAARNAVATAQPGAPGSPMLRARAPSLASVGGAATARAAHSARIDGSAVRRKP